MLDSLSSEIITIFITIAGFFINIFYSRHLFKQQNYPDVYAQFHLEVEDLTTEFNTYPTLLIRNGSMDRMINNVFLKIEIGVKTSNQKTQWHHFTNAQTETLTPTQAFHIRGDESGRIISIESFLNGNFSPLIESHNLIDETTQRPLNRRVLSQDFAVYLKYHLKYRRGIHGLADAKMWGVFILKPEYEIRDNLKVLKDWKVKVAWYTRRRNKYVTRLN